MKARSTKRCLLAATIWFLTMFAVGVAAQEAQHQEAQQTQPAAAAQRLFVDRLVLNVYAQADQGSERVATIETGDSVEALERMDNFVRVRLEDGREGWVGANYLTSNAPAAVRLRELQHDRSAAAQAAESKAAEEIARLRKENALLQAQVNELRSAAVLVSTATPDNSSSAPPASASPAGESHPSVPAAPGSPESKRALWMWPIIVVLAIGVGYGAGYQTLASRIRRKFGGLKIY